MKGAFADWYEELAQQISDVSSTGTGIPVAKANDESESKVAPTVVSILTTSPSINVPTRGNSVQQHREKLNTLPEDIGVSKASVDAGFPRKVSPGQYFADLCHENMQKHVCNDIAKWQIKQFSNYKKSGLYTMS